MISLTKLLTFFDLTRNPAPEPTPEPAPKLNIGTHAVGRAWTLASADLHLNLWAETYGGEGRA